MTMVNYKGHIDLIGPSGTLTIHRTRSDFLDYHDKGKQAFEDMYSSRTKMLLSDYELKVYPFVVYASKGQDGMLFIKLPSGQHSLVTKVTMSAMLGLGLAEVTDADLVESTVSDVVRRYYGKGKVGVEIVFSKYAIVNRKVSFI